MLTSAAKRVLDDPIALWEHLAVNVARRHRTQAESDATFLLAVEVAAASHESRAGYATAVVFGLDALGWVRSNGAPLGPRDVLDLLDDSWRVFESVNAFEMKNWSTARSRPAVERSPVPCFRTGEPTQAGDIVAAEFGGMPRLFSSRNHTSALTDHDHAGQPQPSGMPRARIRRRRSLVLAASRQAAFLFFICGDDILALQLLADQRLQLVLAGQNDAAVRFQCHQRRAFQPIPALPEGRG